MKIKFFGAARTVTGSRYLLKAGGRQVLVDCGLFQGYKELRERNWQPFPTFIPDIDDIVLTHAHIDHTGYLPVLVRDGFEGSIYASDATRDLCEILLRDSGRIQEEDAKRANRYGYSKHKPALPLYTEEDANRALERFKPFTIGKEFYLGDQLRCQASRAGHILGSCILSFRTDSTSIVFSGDMGKMEDPVMNAPATLQTADYLVLESTYGNRLHEESNALEELGAVVRQTVENGGVVVIPAFAVGRTQMMLYLLNELIENDMIPKVPIYLDSPMAQDVTDILCRYVSEHKLPMDQCKIVSRVAQYTRSVDESKALHTDDNPKIIISASGMLEGGRVLHHIKKYGSDKKNAIVFTGFQAPMTRGDRILSGAKEIKIHGEMIRMRAKVIALDSLSSHADYDDLLTWLKGFTKAPRKVFLTHGEPEASMALKSRIEDQFGWNVEVPRYLDEFDL